MENKDLIVKKLIDEIANRKATLANVNNPQWKTSCVVSTYLSSSVHSTRNIQTVRDITELVSLFANILVWNEFNNKASEILNLSADVTFSGYTFEDWKHDFKLRANQIQVGQTRSELEDLEKRVDKLISKEERERMEIEAISKTLGISIK